MITPQEEARAIANMYLAWADGKKLQRMNTNGRWVDFEPVGIPTIADLPKWRIKPSEPRVIWMRADNHQITFSAKAALSWHEEDGVAVSVFVERLPQ